MISLQSGCISVWWYPSFKSIFENTFASARRGKISSSFGIWCFSRIMASFGHGIFKHNLIVPFALGMGTTGETHVVGPEVGSIMSSFCNNLILSETFFLVWNGRWHIGCWIETFAWSMCNLSWTFFNFPTPWNVDLCLSKIICVEADTEDKWFTNSCGSPIQSKLIAVTMFCPMSEPLFPLITKNVALVCLSCALTYALNIPNMCNGALALYG